MKKYDEERQLCLLHDSPADISKGDLLEYRIKRLFFYMGYYSKVGIIVKTSTDDNADIITDLDVYGIYLHNNFVSKRIWADCKSGKAKPLERISWIKGVRSSIRIDDVFFIKDGIRPSTKSFARKSNILTIDSHAISKLEKDYKINSDDWRGSYNPNSQMNRLVELKQINCLNSDELKRISNFISSNYWVIDEYARVKKSITAISSLAEMIPIVKEKELSTIYWAIYETVCLFTLAVFNICRDLYYLSADEVRTMIKDGMISGEISAKKRAEIVEATYSMAIKMVKQEIPSYSGPIINTEIGITPPDYYDKFVDFTGRIISNPLDYFDILRILDFMFMEYDLNKISIDDKEMLTRFPNYQRAKTSIKTILHFVTDVCSIPKTIFSILS